MYFLCHYKNLAIIRRKTNRIFIRNENNEIKKFICLNEELSKFLYRHIFLAPPFSGKRWKEKSYIKTLLKYLYLAMKRKNT
jgi:predicted transcriptional regulator YheO